MEKMPTLEQGISEQKERGIEKLIEGEPDAVFILTGAMKFNEKKGVWESGTYQDRDENSGLVTGGKDRVVAAAEIARCFPETIIVPMSQTNDPEKPTYAEVMEHELERIGVPKENIVLETESKTTITELKAIVEFTSKYDWKNIVLLSSGYHIPRIEAMLRYLSDFADTDEERAALGTFLDQIESGDIRVQLVGSDGILMARDDHYKAYFDKVYADPDYQKKVEQENRATRQILETGTYGPYTLTQKE